MGDQSLHELQVRIDQLYTTLVEERNNHTRCKDEERNAFRKVHDEHMHIVEKERDARIRQINELRTDLTKSMRDRDVPEGMTSGESYLGRSTMSPFRSISGVAAVAGNLSTTGSGTVSVGSATIPAGSATIPAGPPPLGVPNKLSSIISNLRAQKLQE